MSRGARIRYSQTTGPLRAAIDAALGRPENAKPKRSGRHALVGQTPIAESMVDLPGPLLVRITRIIPCVDGLDDDNLSGGDKQLRDAIASMLGRKGDSAKDGLWWEYREEQGPNEVRIDIYKKEND